MQTPIESTPLSDGANWNHCLDLLDALPTLPVEERADIVEQLIRNPRPGIRERALRVGIAVLPDTTLIGYLRSDADAVVRNAGLEILKEKGGNSLSLAIELLRDPDPDVALQAVLLLDHIGDPRALEPLRSALRHEDPNIVQAAMVAVGHLGDRRVIPDLLPFLSADLWLQMASVQALGDLRSSEAIEPIAELLTDLMVGPTAAEAIAQIGGSKAFEVLSRHWLSYRDALDTENMVGLLAHVLEGLPSDPPSPSDFRRTLGEHLRDPFRGVRTSAARCLLALGSGPEDTEALAVLTAGNGDSDILPSCLARRADLAGQLLEKPLPQAAWGFELCARFPDRVSSSALASGIWALPGFELPQQLLDALEKVGDSDLAAPLLELYLRVVPAEQPRLLPVLEANRVSLAAAIDDIPTITESDRVVLQTVLGHPLEDTKVRLLALPSAERTRVLRLLLDQVELLRSLPWQDWLDSEPETYLEIASLAAVRSGLRELLPELRKALETTRVAEAVKAVGELGDRDSVSQLAALCEEDEPGLLRPLAIESLGRIGGAEAREVLRRIANSHEGIDARLAYRALAQCAAEEDDGLFREAAKNSDWYIRLSAVEALSRYSRPENLRRLSELAADPVALVAQRALAALRSK